MPYSQTDPVLRPLKPGLRPAPQLSLVIPCYNEEPMLPILLDHLFALEAELMRDGRIGGEMEIVLVDDGSQDATWRLIEEAGRSDGVVGVRLSRNHGHQPALLAGLMQATGEVVISMDADLQDDLAAVGQMLDKYRAGAEVVYGVRDRRDTDTRFKRWTARAYYKMLGDMGVDLVPDHADFRLMSRRAIEALASFGESNLFLRGMIPQLGFASDIVLYDRAARAAGVSKYPLRKMLALAFEGVTSFSVRPLRMIAVIGAVVAGFSMLYVAYSLVMWALGHTVQGWTSIVMSLYLLGGLHLFALGVIGEYVGKIYRETKRRPRFIIDEVTGRPAVQDGQDLRHAVARPAYREAAE